MHVHAIKGKGSGGGEARFDISGDTPELMTVYGLSDRDVNKAEAIVLKHITTLQAEWRQIHSDG